MSFQNVSGSSAVLAMSIKSNDITDRTKCMHELNCKLDFLAVHCLESSRLFTNAIHMA